jgi:hypothetical protein
MKYIKTVISYFAIILFFRSKKPRIPFQFTEFYFPWSTPFFHFNGLWEEDVVLQVNVLVQISFEFIQ